MASLSEVHVKVVPELDPKFEALLGTATADTLAKLDAGAALVYAIYHTPKADVEFFNLMPKSVRDAYARASAAYRVGRAGRKEETSDADPTAP